MDIISVFNRKIALLLIFFILPHLIGNTKVLDKKNTQTIKSMLMNLHDKNNTIVQVSYKSSHDLFILMTDKTCLSCYTKLEQYLQSFYKNYNVNFIVLMEDEPLLIRDKIKTITQYYKSFSTIYFYYYDKEAVNSGKYNSFMQQLIASPSPYFFVTDNKSNKIDFIDYADTEKLLYSTDR